MGREQTSTGEEKVGNDFRIRSEIPLQDERCKASAVNMAPWWEHLKQGAEPRGVFEIPAHPAREIVAGQYPTNTTPDEKKMSVGSLK